MMYRNETLRVTPSAWVSMVVPISPMSCGRLDPVRMVQCDHSILGLVAWRRGSPGSLLGGTVAC